MIWYFFPLSFLGGICVVYYIIVLGKAGSLAGIASPVLHIAPHPMVLGLIPPRSCPKGLHLWQSVTGKGQQPCRLNPPLNAYGSLGQDHIFEQPGALSSLTWGWGWSQAERNSIWIGFFRLF